MSDSEEIKNLEARIRELEKFNLMKQFEIDFKTKMIEIAEEMYGIDFRKKYDDAHRSKSGPSKEKS